MGEAVRTCACGCGQDPGRYTRARKDRDVEAGHPRRFVPGHSGRSTRFTPKSDVPYREEDRGHDTPCWIWLRGRRGGTGYGALMLRRDGKDVNVLAHRHFYEMRNGSIPEGRVLDHLCRTRECVNPTHLEPVSPSENAARGAAAKLTYEEVRHVRLLHSTGKQNLVELGVMYGVSSSYVSRLVNYENRKDGPRTIAVGGRARCASCEGSGSTNVSGSRLESCGACGGMGKVLVVASEKSKLPGKGKGSLLFVRLFPGRGA